MEYHDYYQTLGLAKTATPEQIKKAYRKMARAHPPDLNPDNPAAEQKFKEANEAHEVLSDPEKRKKYDRLGADWHRYEQAGGGPGAGGPRSTGGGSGGPGGGGFDWSQYAEPGAAGGDFGGDEADFSDFFGSIFGGAGGGGGGGSRPGAGQDYRAELTLTLAEAYAGGPRTLTVGGKSLRLTIKPGVADGQTIRLRGQGGPGRNGGPPGDLLLTFRLAPDPRYARTGPADLVQDVPVPLYLALLGGPLTVESVGGPVKITLQPETPNGTRLRLRGKGFPVYDRPGEFGDLYLRLSVQLPQGLSAAEKDLITQLAALRAG